MLNEAKCESVSYRVISTALKARELTTHVKGPDMQNYSTSKELIFLRRFCSSESTIKINTVELLQKDIPEIRHFFNQGHCLGSQLNRVL